MTAKILTVDIETQRGIAGVFDRFSNYIHEDRILVPTRILCFAAKWRGEDKTIFKAAWDEDENYHVIPEQYEAMLQVAFDLLDEADFVVTFNGDVFDLQWFQAEFRRLWGRRPAPYRSIDLKKISKKNFSRGLMSQSLNWSARHVLHDEKVKHGGTDLWDDIRYGNRATRRAAQRTMKQYNIHDVKITEDLFENDLPWIGENFALYEDTAGDGEIRCTQCSRPESEMQRRGYQYTTSYKYPRYLCPCGKWNKGRRMLYTTELRPV
ncbi:hypothetical protein A5747_13495 [Mycobacterium sp. IS-836]|uniref:hypothetical protein n=1 Tax=Mycobacterium sp. IS-836 TaxID=1834160 RepID=UPI00096E4584|nr:hypothetical protein [Mycobacterium sp. IS-836]OMC55402.1 hypothetical protein A5747_13495 [Mycobacterium sp. IS-836]